MMRAKALRQAQDDNPLNVLDLKVSFRLSPAMLDVSVIIHLKPKMEKFIANKNFTIKQTTQMKKMISLALLITVTTMVFAQTDKFAKAMEPKIAVLDTTRDGATLQDLSNSFERIAATEKTQWLPFYYAALAQTNLGYSKLTGGMSGDPAVIDPIADKAEGLLAEAEKLSPKNSEIFVVRKMINSLRMLVDPQSRFMQYGPAAQQALETAKTLNPENPRIYLLEGQDKFFTPEQYGGSKEEAKKLFETALQKYNAFKPESTLTPGWGKWALQYFMGQLK
jgi:hypothetical protein